MHSEQTGNDRIACQVEHLGAFGIFALRRHQWRLFFQRESPRSGPRAAACARAVDHGRTCVNAEHRRVFLTNARTSGAVAPGFLGMGKANRAEHCEEEQAKLFHPTPRQGSIDYARN